jgi:hypothetical protein
VAPRNDLTAVARGVIDAYDRGTMRTCGPCTSPTIPGTCRGRPEVEVVAIRVVAVAIMLGSAGGRIGGSGVMMVPTAGIGDRRAALVGDGRAEPQHGQRTGQQATGEGTAEQH